MKKVVIFMRAGFDADFICDGISEISSKYETFIIYETGRSAKKKKIRRMIKNEKNIFLALINMFLLVIYDRIMIWAMSGQCKINKRFKVDPFYIVNDVNEIDSINICNKIQPNIVLIYGTGILKSSTIKQIGADIYNIHSSMLPYYRNVHSDFWAYMNKEYNRIGITVFKVDEGIDTGKIAKQIACDISYNSKLYEFKVENLRNIVKIIPSFLDDYFGGNIELKEQDTLEGSVSNTPGVKALFKFAKEELKNLSIEKIRKYPK